MVVEVINLDAHVTAKIFESEGYVAEENFLTTSTNEEQGPDSVLSMQCIKHGSFMSCLILGP